MAFYLRRISKYKDKQFIVRVICFQISKLRQLRQFKLRNNKLLLIWSEKFTELYLNDDVIKYFECPYV